MVAHLKQRVPIIWINAQWGVCGTEGKPMINIQAMRDDLSGADNYCVTASAYLEALDELEQTRRALTYAGLLLYPDGCPITWACVPGTDCQECRVKNLIRDAAKEVTP